MHLHPDQPHVHKGPSDVPGPTSSGNQNSEDAFMRKIPLYYENFTVRGLKRKKARESRVVFLIKKIMIILAVL